MKKLLSSRFAPVSVLTRIHESEQLSSLERIADFTVRQVEPEVFHPDLLRPAQSGCSCINIYLVGVFPVDRSGTGGYAGLNGRSFEPPLSDLHAPPRLLYGYVMT